MKPECPPGTALRFSLLLYIYFGSGPAHVRILRYSLSSYLAPFCFHGCRVLFFYVLLAGGYAFSIGLPIPDPFQSLTVHLSGALKPYIYPITCRRVFTCLPTLFCNIDCYMNNSFKSRKIPNATRGVNCTPNHVTRVRKLYRCFIFQGQIIKR